MATQIRRTEPHLKAITDAYNALKAQIGPSTKFHLDVFESTVTAPDATDGPSAIVLANNIRAVMLLALADVLAHKVADPTDSTVLAPCIDNTTCIALVLDLATKYETHRASTTYHYTTDATNTLSSTTVTTISQAQSVATDLKAKMNAHMASAPSAPSLRLVAG